MYRFTHTNMDLDKCFKRKDPHKLLRYETCHKNILLYHDDFLQPYVKFSFCILDKIVFGIFSFIFIYKM